jgi:hypothetical protein
MQERAPSPPREGLCATCAHARRVENDRGSVFVRCAYAAVDPSFPKYPRLPVMSCAAYQVAQDGGADAATREPSSSR